MGIFSSQELHHYHLMGLRKVYSSMALYKCLGMQYLDLQALLVIILVLLTTLACIPLLIKKLKPSFRPIAWLSGLVGVVFALILHAHAFRYGWWVTQSLFILLSAVLVVIFFRIMGRPVFAGVQKTDRAKTSTKTVKVTESSKVKTSETLIWESAEVRPHRSWWWWGKFVCIAFIAVLIACVLHLWFFAGLLSLIFATLGIFFISKPATHRYELDGISLRIDSAMVDLTFYNSCYLEPPRLNLPEAPETLMLLPAKSFGLPLSLPLPKEADKADAILKMLTAIVPFEKSDKYHTSIQLFDRLGRWLKLR